MMQLPHPKLLDLLGLHIKDMVRDDDYRVFCILYFETFAIFAAEAPYLIHLRPSRYLEEYLKDKPYLRRLSIRSLDTEWKSPGEMENLLDLGITEGDPLILRLEFERDDADAEKQIREVIDIILRFKETKDYADKQAELKKEREQAGREAGPGDAAQFERDYTTARQEYFIVKLLLENFFLERLVPIEKNIKAKSRDQRGDKWDIIDWEICEILQNQGLGFYSLCATYDNLLQLREMLFTKHEIEKANRVALDWKDYERDWTRRQGQAWRETHNRRIVYFYERESIYYRDLFLAVTIRSKKRMDRFLVQWGQRLSDSLYKRRHIDKELGKFRTEMQTFNSNFPDQEMFTQRIDYYLYKIKAKISEYDYYLEMIWEREIDIEE